MLPSSFSIWRRNVLLTLGPWKVPCAHKLEMRHPTPQLILRQHGPEIWFRDLLSFPSFWLVTSLDSEKLLRLWHFLGRPLVYPLQEGTLILRGFCGYKQWKSWEVTKRHFSHRVLFRVSRWDQRFRSKPLRCALSTTYLMCQPKDLSTLASIKIACELATLNSCNLITTYNKGQNGWIWLLQLKRERSPSRCLI